MNVSTRQQQEKKRVEDIKAILWYNVVIMFSQLSLKCTIVFLTRIINSSQSTLLYPSSSSRQDQEVFFDGSQEKTKKADFFLISYRNDSEVSVKLRASIWSLQIRWDQCSISRSQKARKTTLRGADGQTGLNFRRLGEQHVYVVSRHNWFQLSRIIRI